MSHFDIDREIPPSLSPTSRQGHHVLLPMNSGTYINIMNFLDIDSMRMTSKQNAFLITCFFKMWTKYI